ncbi:MAG: hypothetical protein JSS61_01935 [Verrucomicrobia bacterium]|nr:hypothetical protein [Verrucomicrobiota bacterium]
MEIYSLGYALLATQNALLDVIAPELRAVVVDFCKDEGLLYIRFYYDGEACEKLIDLWQCAITEASAAMGPDCLLDEAVERLDYPQKIPQRGRFAYLRRESNDEGFSSFSKEIVDFGETCGAFVCPVSGKIMPTQWGICAKLNGIQHYIPARPWFHRIEITPVAYLILCIQRELLGSITSDLRAVIADYTKEDQKFYLRLYYHGQVSKELINLWQSAIIKTVADLGVEYRLDAEIERLDYPLPIPFRGRYAFMRLEKA